ncbi:MULTISPECIES: ThuA domain-containing protein [unclassified Streptomyces]|uniref:ThuA domain-containing protein n=1 Tax=unclassified Streptomyces TaxID=2593676 RepID=UPI0036E8C834
MPRTASPTALAVFSGDDVHEDLFTAAREVRTLLTDEGFVTRTAVGTGRFDGPVDAELIVLYTALGRFTDAQRASLARAVRGGAGLIALHSTTVDADLFDLVGSRYVSHGPPPHESRFTVTLDGAHEVTAGIPPFELTHEHYHVETAPGVLTLARRTTPGGTEPLLHVREFGDGRVCYLQLGHDMRSWGEPAVRLLVRRAARWACRLEARGN